MFCIKTSNIHMVTWSPLNSYLFKQLLSMQFCLHRYLQSGPCSKQVLAIMTSLMTHKRTLHEQCTYVMASANMEWNDSQKGKQKLVCNGYLFELKGTGKAIALLNVR